MKKIYKYQIPSAEAAIAMPQGATILSVAAQNEVPCLWVMVDPNQPTVEKHIRIVATGEALEDEAVTWSFIGTFFLDSGALVFHVFEVNLLIEVDLLTSNLVVSHKSRNMIDNI